MIDERFAPTTDPATARLVDPWWGVNAARYAWAAPQVAGALVLDVAAGSGYGLGLLDASAAVAVGVDADLASLRGVRSLGLTVTAGLGGSLPFPDRTFDVVTSFETIEHLHDRPAFVGELARVLRPEGTLLLSTPNARHTRPVDGVPRNPYHVHEYEPDELRSELLCAFGDVRLLGQTRHPRFKTPPFVDEQQDLPTAARLRLLLWKAASKLPLGGRQLVARTLLRRPTFFPTETDYEFRPDTVATAPVTVAVCRSPKP